MQVRSAESPVRYHRQPFARPLYGQRPQFQIEVLNVWATRIVLWSFYISLVIAFLLRYYDPYLRWDCRSLCGESCKPELKYKIGHDHPLSVDNSCVMDGLKQDGHDTLVLSSWTAPPIQMDPLNRYLFVSALIPAIVYSSVSSAPPEVQGHIEKCVELAVVVTHAKIIDQVRVPFRDLLAKQLDQHTLWWSDDLADDEYHINISAIQVCGNPNSVNTSNEAEVTTAFAADLSHQLSFALFFHDQRHTIAEVVFRHVLMLIACLAFGSYLRNLFAASRFMQWLPEQLWLVSLHIALILFNLNPLLVPSIFDRDLENRWQARLLHVFEFHLRLYFHPLVRAFQLVLVESAGGAEVFLCKGRIFSASMIASAWFACVVGVDAIHLGTHGFSSRLHLYTSPFQVISNELSTSSLGDAGDAVYSTAMALLTLTWLFLIIRAVIACHFRLKRIPYMPTRHRQLMFRFYCVLCIFNAFYAIAVYSVSLATAYDVVSPPTLEDFPELGLSDLLTDTVFVIIFGYLYTPTNERSGAPPAPGLGGLWTKIRWPTRWVKWLKRHGCSIYFFHYESEKLDYIHAQSQRQPPQDLHLLEQMLENIGEFRDYVKHNLIHFRDIARSAGGRAQRTGRGLVKEVAATVAKAAHIVRLSASDHPQPDATASEHPPHHHHRRHSRRPSPPSQGQPQPQPCPGDQQVHPPPDPQLQPPDHASPPAPQSPSAASVTSSSSTSTSSESERRSVPFFCVEIAVEMWNLSWEAYWAEPPDFRPHRLLSSAEAAAVAVLPRFKSGGFQNRRRYLENSVVSDWLGDASQPGTFRFHSAFVQNLGNGGLPHRLVLPGSRSGSTSDILTAAAAAGKRLCPVRRNSKQIPTSRSHDSNSNLAVAPMHLRTQSNREFTVIVEAPSFSADDARTDTNGMEHIPVAQPADNGFAEVTNPEEGAVQGQQHTMMEGEEGQQEIRLEIDQQNAPALNESLTLAVVDTSVVTVSESGHHLLLQQQLQGHPAGFASHDCLSGYSSVLGQPHTIASAALTPAEVSPEKPKSRDSVQSPVPAVPEAARFLFNQTTVKQNGSPRKTSGRKFRSSSCVGPTSRRTSGTRNENDDRTLDQIGCLSTSGVIFSQAPIPSLAEEQNQDINGDDAALGSCYPPSRQPVGSPGLDPGGLSSTPLAPRSSNNGPTTTTGSHDHSASQPQPAQNVAHKPPHITVHFSSAATDDCLTTPSLGATRPQELQPPHNHGSQLPSSTGTSPPRPPRKLPRRGSSLGTSDLDGSDSDDGENDQEENGDVVRDEDGQPTNVAAKVSEALLLLPTLSLPVLEDMIEQAKKGKKVRLLDQTQMQLERYGYSLYAVVNWASNQAIITTSKTRITVAFRGTDNIDNILSDINFIHTPIQGMASSKQPLRPTQSMMFLPAAQHHQVPLSSCTSNVYGPYQRSTHLSPAGSVVFHPHSRPSTAPSSPTGGAGGMTNSFGTKPKSPSLGTDCVAAPAFPLPVDLENPGGLDPNKAGTDGPKLSFLARARKFLHDLYDRVTSFWCCCCFCCACDVCGKCYGTLAPPMAHSGFYSAWMRLRDDVMAAVCSAIEQYPDKRTIFVTGHSLGGALATFAAYEIAERYREDHEIVMYNFGTPRVGNRAFKRLYDSMVPDSYRIVNDRDVIPGMPPPFSLLGGCFRHVGREVRVDNRGNMIIEPTFLERSFTAHRSRFVPHKMESYRRSLEAVCEYLDMNLPTEKAPFWLARGISN